MVRAQRLLTAIGGAGLTLLLSASPGAGGSDVTTVSVLSHGASRPDIILIISDDQPQGVMEPMPQVRREFGQLGVEYTQAMVPTALCCPSRASILTGMYAHGTKVWTNGNVTEETGYPGGHEAFVQAGNEAKTLAVALDDSGYRTGLIGKYLNGYSARDGTPPGWDVWLPFQSPASYYDYKFDDVRHGDDPHDYSTDVIARRAVRTIDHTRRKRPLFLMIAPFGPHWPYTPAPRDTEVDVRSYVQASDFGAFNERNTSDKPAWVRQLKPVKPTLARRVARQQHRAVMSVDDLVGKVVDAVRARSSTHNTLLIFMSDNGLLWGAHRIIGKDVPYRDATEVPLFVRYDPKLPNGGIRDRLVVNVDVTATIAHVAGVRRQMPWIEGHSLFAKPPKRPGFVLEATYSHPHPPIGFERPPYCGWRTKNKLYVRYNSGFEEFYQYRLDPLEETNLVNRARWRSTVRTMRDKSREACSPRPPGFTWFG